MLLLNPNSNRRYLYPRPKLHHRSTTPLKKAYIITNIRVCIHLILILHAWITMFGEDNFSIFDLSRSRSPSPSILLFFLKLNSHRRHLQPWSKRHHRSTSPLRKKYTYGSTNIRACIPQFLILHNFLISLYALIWSLSTLSFSFYLVVLINPNYNHCCLQPWPESYHRSTSPPKKHMTLLILEHVLLKFLSCMYELRCLF